MNWGRGLLRFWVFFTVLWVLGCTALAFLNPPSTAKYELEDVNKEKFHVTVPTGMTPQAIVDQFIASKKMNRPECAPDKRGPWCEQVTALEIAAPVRWQLVALAAAVPAGILAIGWSLLWAFRGFAPSAKRPEGAPPV